MPVQFASLESVERRTGDGIFAVELPGEADPSGSTTVYLPAIPDNNLRHVMWQWAYSLPRNTSATDSLTITSAAHRCLLAVGSEGQAWPALAWISPSEEASPTAEWDESDLTAEQAITRVMKILDIPKRDILAAAGVAPTTYYYWKRSAKRGPRLTSTGRAWSLLQTIEDLREVLGRNLSAWLNESTERRKDFRAGRFDKLNAEALAERSPRERAGFRAGTSESVGVEDTGPRMAKAKPLQGRVVGGSGVITRRNA